MLIVVALAFISILATVLLTRGFKRLSQLEHLEELSAFAVDVGNTFCVLNNLRHTLPGYISLSEKAKTGDSFAKLRVDLFLKDKERVEETIVATLAHAAQLTASNYTSAQQVALSDFLVCMGDVNAFLEDIYALRVNKLQGQEGVEALQNRILTFMGALSIGSSDAATAKQLSSLTHFLVAKRDLWRWRGAVFTHIANNNTGEISVDSAASVYRSSITVNEQRLVAEANAEGGVSRVIEAFYNHPNVDTYFKAAAFLNENLITPGSSEEERRALFERVQIFQPKIKTAYYELSEQALEAVSGVCEALTEKLQEEASSERRSVYATAAVVVCGFLFSLFMFWRIDRSVTKVVRDVGEDLQSGSERVSRASHAVRNASQSIADIASKEASSYEEITATMSELANSSKQNTKMLNDSSSSANEAGRSVESGVRSMEELKSAMLEIDNSSKEISAIIGSIEEVAFQTNILALNAAVEAARAGEAGAGFSVVAEEVRSLAQRSARAAADTNQRIGNALKNSADGMSKTKDVEAHLESVVQRIGEFFHSTEKVARAVNDQAEGIDGVAEAMRQLNESSQVLAARSEENAASAVEMESVSRTIEKTSHSLQDLVGGTKEVGGRSSSIGSREEMSQMNPEYSYEEFQFRN